MKKTIVSGRKAQKLNTKLGKLMNEVLDTYEQLELNILMSDYQKNNLVPSMEEVMCLEGRIIELRDRMLKVITIEEEPKQRKKTTHKK